VSAVFLKYELSDVIVSSLEEGGASGGGVPQEQIAMNFQAVKIAYSTQNADGQLGAPVTAAVNCGK
jgi:type VI protein secretion system component Hcp